MVKSFLLCSAENKIGSPSSEAQGISAYQISTPASKRLIYTADYPFDLIFLWMRDDRFPSIQDKMTFQHKIVIEHRGREPHVSCNPYPAAAHTLSGIFTAYSTNRSCSTVCNITVRQTSNMVGQIKFGG
ncbi:hypothetical protein AB6A40_003815 [Gnathostoma spinigerum]|uniref:Uncharacterized protein n=1 Tax=Gnathostoma spinigerum TaxID=75299 RepID=A0ABD6EBS8_9BILA